MPAGGAFHQPPHASNTYGHSRNHSNNTVSSANYPQINYHPQPPQSQHQHQQHLQQQQQQLYPGAMQISPYTSRRTLSTATFSTTASSGNGPYPLRASSQDLRRSTSSRSGGMASPQGYVALMRKQKATVWCDRAQHEDPRLLAAQKAAKQRAALEVVGKRDTTVRTATSAAGSLAGSNRVTAKIRHGGKAGLLGYSPGDLVGGVGGVPMRLSASEVEGGDSDDDGDSGYQHHRTGSGRSSVGSNGRRGYTYAHRQSSVGSRMSAAGNSSSNERLRQGSVGDIAEGETPVPIGHVRAKDYFSAGDGNQDGSRSAGSGSSGERADSVADLSNAARLASSSLINSTVSRQKSVRNPDELRRRGSVDDRTMTMSATRLFIANPDNDDSD